MTVLKTADEALDSALVHLRAGATDLAHASRQSTQEANRLVQAGTVQGLWGILSDLVRRLEDLRSFKFNDERSIASSADVLSKVVDK